MQAPDVRLIPTFLLIKYTKNLQRDFHLGGGWSVHNTLHIRFRKKAKRGVCVFFSKWDSSDNVRWSPCQGRQHW